MSLPSWVAAAVPGVTGLWAPDISFYNVTWWLLYAASTFGSQISAIGLATNPTLNASDARYAWTDLGRPVLASRKGDPFNAIDPCLFEDASGRRWLSFGSFWGGIYAVPWVIASPSDAPALRPSQELQSHWGAGTAPDQQPPPPLHLAQRAAPDALEASHLFLRGPWVYLLASWNYCCRGNASTYEVSDAARGGAGERSESGGLRAVAQRWGPPLQVRMGRAPVAGGGITAPFVDAAGVPLLQGGGTRLVGGGYGWAAAGGQSMLRGAPGQQQQQLMVLHAYDGVSGDPWLQVRPPAVPDPRVRVWVCTSLPLPPAPPSSGGAARVARLLLL